MKEIEKVAIVTSLLEEIEMISGKFFLRSDHSEIKDIKSCLAKTYLKKHQLVILDSDLKQIVSTLNNYNEAGDWYDPPIIAKARELGPCSDEMAFDLDDKQLTIINQLCFHPEDERCLFITTGTGGTGKSTFMNIVKQIFDNDFSSASLSDLANGFTVAEAVKHRLICSDELAKGDLNCSVIKQLASKQDIYVNPKGITGYNVKSQSRCFWCCNVAPVIDVQDGGMPRRIVYYERNKKIRNPNPLLKNKVFSFDELVTIVRNAMRFENPNWFDTFQLETHKHIMAKNTVYRYINNQTYEGYKNCCINASLHPYAEPNWEEIRALFREWIDEDELIESLGDLL